MSRAKFPEVMAFPRSRWKPTSSPALLYKNERMSAVPRCNEAEPEQAVPSVGHPKAIKATIDEDLLQFSEVWAVAGTPHTVARIRPAELVQASGGRVAEMKPA
jgi:hypothetical protein